MLGKLLKYEFKATARIFLLMYVALLALALLNAAVIPFNGRAFFSFMDVFGDTIHAFALSLSAFLYILVATGVIIITFVIIVVRFYRMLGNEGYLWFTLPVTANQHLLSKLIAAFVWSIASSIAIIISVLVLMLPTGYLNELHRIPELWSQLVSYGFNPGLWLGCAVLLLFASWLCSTLQFYAAISIGPNLVKSRFGGSVLAYIMLYVAVQILTTIELLALAGPIGNQATALVRMADSHYLSIDISSISSIAEATNRLMIFSTASIVLSSLVIAVAFYFLSHFFLSRKLNLA